MDAAVCKRDTRSVLVLGRALHAPWNEGARVIGRDTARALAVHHKVRTVSLTERQFLGQDDALLDVEHIGVSPGIKGDYAALPRVTRRVGALLNEQPADVVHLIGLPLVLVPLLRRRIRRVVVHITMVQHAYLGHIDQLRATLGWRLFDRWIDAYACTSQPVYEALVRQGYPQHKLHVVPPPLDMQCFRPMNRADARRWLGVGDNEFVVVYIGTVSPLRFPAREVVAALQEAKTAIPLLRLEIIAPLGTHSYNLTWAREHVDKALASDVSLARIQLRDLDETQKAMLYNAADVLLLPFQAPVAVEPPLTLLEAMACQTCVLVYPHANRSAVVVNGHNGITVTGSTHLADALQYLAAQPALWRARVGQMARIDIAQTHSFPFAAQSLEKLWMLLDAADRSASAADTR